MGLISQDQALTILASHLAPMRNGIEVAWEEIRKYPERLRWIHDATARANNMNCEMRFAATQYFSQQPDARVCTLCRATLYVVGERVALRYKKLSRDLLPQNIPTYQAQAIAHQQDMDGMSDITYLNVGYILDRSETKLERICMTCPNGDDRNYWEYDLQKAEDITKIRDLYERCDEDETDSIVRGKTDKRDSDEDQS